MAAALVLLLRNLITPVFQSPDKSLLSVSNTSKLFHLLRYLFFSFFFLVLHFFTCLLPFSLPYKTTHHDVIIPYKESSAVGRALDQLLALVGEIPVSSRKYDVVRSLAEKLMHENLEEEDSLLALRLREVNCAALSAAFSRTMARLEVAVVGTALGRLGEYGLGLGPAVRAVKGWCVGAGLRRGGDHQGEVSAEKLAAELEWLAEKLEESGGVETAVEKWASAAGLGQVALTAEPRVQASLVKLTAFLIKQAKNMSMEQETQGRGKEKESQTKMKLLTTWIPLLCRGRNGEDAPVLSRSQREEIEKALEVIIERQLDQDEDNQEKVLSLWLHHFSQCPSSDWPNLNALYIRWYTASRNLLIAQSQFSDTMDLCKTN